eukprot:TRINITY_DN10925_c0_g1_i1.p1 TRINITY_DN10925_c0_g1~~TRINITY_DN10925_c0_g1_i1.p1  ORF type:complete len:119 (-),score=19.77 TRINITY_DN10925_c0_g1_i1:301-657(-)
MYGDLPPAFEISEETDLGPPSGPPTNGLEYLKSVRWEAKQLPNVFVSNINPRDYDEKQTRYGIPPPVPKGCLEPNKKWKKEFIESFKNLRQRIESLRKHKNQKKNKFKFFASPSISRR